MTAYRIVLADDHVMLRQGLRTIVEAIPGVAVTGEAGNGLELLDLVKRSAPDLVIVDISMPKLRGLEAIPEITLLAPDTQILVLTMHKNREYVAHALAAGANGYVLKDEAAQDLCTAIETLRRGRRYLSPALAGPLSAGGPQPSTAGPAAVCDALSNREREVLKLLAEGQTSREIGRQLFISTRTVEHHRARILRKLGKKNTTELLQYALQQGYV